MFNALSVPPRRRSTRPAPPARLILAALASLGLGLGASAAQAEPLVWSIQSEQLEYRLGEDGDVFAWDVDAVVGSDELKARYMGAGEYGFEPEAFETFENRFLLQAPVSDFFDAKAGVRYDAPDGPNRLYATLGLQGLAPQWFEVDLDLFVSEKGDPSLRLDAEYEALLTNWVILTPSLEVDLPFTDDAEIGAGAWGPQLEVGARLSYDLVDRLLSPYVGVHYERSFGESADLAEAEGEDAGALFAVVGTRLQF